MKDNLAYENDEDNRKEERIDGVVCMSPRPSTGHNHICRNISTIFSVYLRGKRCTPFSDGVDLYLTEKDRFVPDMMVVCDPDKIKRKGVYGAPDLAVEVLSPATARNDRGKKKTAYERAGVREYWLVSPVERTVEIHLLKDGKFELSEIYTYYRGYDLEDMTEEERAAVPVSFQCSLFDDLDILLEDVFERVD